MVLRVSAEWAAVHSRRSTSGLSLLRPQSIDSYPAPTPGFLASDVPWPLETPTFADRTAPSVARSPPRNKSRYPESAAALRRHCCSSAVRITPDQSEPPSPYRDRYRLPRRQGL